MIRLVVLTSLVVLGLFGSQQVFAGGNVCTSNADCSGDDVCIEGFCQEACLIVCFVPDPVCGEDGITYICGEPDAACHGVGVSHVGECDIQVGGQIIPIDSTSLILAGTQTTAAWLIPVLVAGAGIVLVFVRKSENHQWFKLTQIISITHALQKHSSSTWWFKSF